MGSSAALVSSGTMTSRVLGVAREQIFAALFGTGPLAEALQVAFLLPNLLRDMLGEGALTAAFVPTFTDELKNRGKAAAFRLANIMLGIVFVGVGALTVLGIVFAPELVAVFTEFGARDASITPLTIQATRLLFPFFPLMSLSAVVMGALNAQEKYGIPAFAPAIHNVVAVSGGAYLLYLGLDGKEALLSWAATLLFAGFAQLAIQIPELRRTGFRFRLCFAWMDPAVLRIARLMGPATLGLAALQINLIVRTWFASQEAHAIPWLGYAFRLFYLPLGLFGVAVATICTTRLAQRAAARDLDGMRTTFDGGLRLIGFLTIPCMVGLTVLGEPIVRVLFERGKFDAVDTFHVAAALSLYALGLYAYSGVKVAAPAFYALDRSRVPVTASMTAVAANLIVSFALFPTYGFLGLAIGMSVAATVNFLVLFVSFHRQFGGLDLSGLLRHLARVLLACIPCGVTAWGVAWGLDSLFGHARFVWQVVTVGLAIASAVLAYGAACKLLGLAEMATVLAFARRRLKR